MQVYLPTAATSALLSPGTKPGAGMQMRRVVSVVLRGPEPATLVRWQNHHVFCLGGGSPNRGRPHWRIVLAEATGGSVMGLSDRHLSEQSLVSVDTEAAGSSHSGAVAHGWAKRNMTSTQGHCRPLPTDGRRDLSATAQRREEPLPRTHQDSLVTGTRCLYLLSYILASRKFCLFIDGRQTSQERN